MNEDLLKLYQKSALKSVICDRENSEYDLLKQLHYIRYSCYLAFLNSQSLCSNPTTCLILESKLNEYSTFIDNRKGIDNFSCVARRLASNITNVSKKWTSGLEKFEPNVSLNQAIRKSECLGSCENASAQGCTVPLPDQMHLEHFFNVLSGLTELSEDVSGAHSDTHITTYDVSGNKTSLYSTYDDRYLDWMKNQTISNTASVQKENNFKSFADNRSEVKLSKSKANREKSILDRFTSLDNTAMKCDSDNSSFSKRMDLEQRRKELSKNNYNNDVEEKKQISQNFFKTASETLKIQERMRFGRGQQYGSHPGGAVKKSLGGKGRAPSNRFVPPLRSSQEEDSEMLITGCVIGRPGTSGSGTTSQPAIPLLEDERLRLIDPKMVELIKSEIIDHSATISWDDIAGLDFAKHTIQEIVVWPMLRPDIFTGLRRPPKGILLFGPPGTGKTLIGKCIASQSKSTFFSISASSLTSKWIGDGEKMVRALFAVARVEQPSVVFIDEIDSLLSQRSDQEHESSRRIKTEFLVQLDGAATGDEDKLLIVGATNRPQELDEAARRRLVKRLYIPLPDHFARRQLVANLMEKERNDLTQDDLEEIAKLTEGYSGADMKNLCQEASLGPIRSLSASLIAHIDPQQVRAVNKEDFEQALKRVRSSVSTKEIELYIHWDKQFGMSS